MKRILPLKSESESDMKNSFLESLVTKIKDSKSNQSNAEWICENTTLGGKKYSFKNHEFQIGIVNDTFPRICTVKTSQIGLTECTIRKTLCFLSRNVARAMYAFPNLLLRNNNAKTRIAPILRDDFPPKNGDIRSSELFQLNSSFLYMASCSEADATSNPVDMLILDELDLADQEIAVLLTSRLQHSAWKIQEYLSTPTFADFGIDAEFKTSDQRQYMYKCEHCNNFFVPKYDLNCVYIPNMPKDVEDLVFDVSPEIASVLDYSNSYVRCPKCLKPINPGDHTRREWVATYPERSNVKHGYKLLPFSSGLLSIKYLVTTVSEGIAKNQARRVINTTLGDVYSDSNTRLEISDIEKCFVTPKIPDIPKDKPIFFGLDMGMGCHLTIVSEDGSEVLRFEVVPQDSVIERISDLLTNYNVIGGMVDRGPFIPTSYELRDISDGKVYPVVYAENNKRVSPFKDVDGKISYYNVDRTMALDAVSEAVRHEKIKFYGYLNQHDTIVSHLRDMVRDDGSEKVRYIKLSGNDHYFHSLAYALTAVYLKRLNSVLNPESPNTSLFFGGQEQKPVDCYDILAYNSTKRKVVRF